MHPPRRYGCPSRIRSFLCLRPSMSPRGCVALRYFLPNSFWLKRFFSPRCTQHHARYVGSAKAAENIAAESFCPAWANSHEQQPAQVTSPVRHGRNGEAGRVSLRPSEASMARAQSNRRRAQDRTQGYFRVDVLISTQTIPIGFISVPWNG